MAKRFLRSCSPDLLEVTGTSEDLKLIKQRYSGNLGNLMFDQVLSDDLVLDSSEKQMSGIDVADVAVMSLANYISTVASPGRGPLEQAVDREQSRLVVAGLGIQYRSAGSVIEIEAAKQATLRAAALRTTSFGVRGYLTERALKNCGVTNVSVIGCPSMSRLRAVAVADSQAPKIASPSRIVVSGTPSGYFRDVLGNLLEFGRIHDARFIVQTEPYLGRTADELVASVSYYTATPRLDPHPIAAWLAERATAFWTMDQWMDGLGPSTLHVGTRIHGAVATLLSGGRALLITTDARTREMADYHAIPVLSPDEFRPGIPVNELWDMADPLITYARTTETHQRFRAFLADNGLSLKDDRVLESDNLREPVFTVDDIAQALGGSDKAELADLTRRLRPDRHETVQELLNLHPHLRRGIDTGAPDVSSRAMHDLIAKFERINSSQR